MLNYQCGSLISNYCTNEVWVLLYECFGIIIYLLPTCRTFIETNVEPIIVIHYSEFFKMRFIIISHEPHWTWLYTSKFYYQYIQISKHITSILLLLLFNNNYYFLILIYFLPNYLFTYLIVDLLYGLLINIVTFVY